MDIASFLRKKGKKWIILYGVYCINFVVYLIIILTLRPYWGEINSTVSGWVNSEIDIVFIVAIILLIPLIYGLYLLIINTIKIRKYEKISLHLLNKIAPIVLIIVYYILIIFLLQMLGDISNTIFQVFEYYSFFLFLGINIGLLIFLYPLIKTLLHLRNYLSNRIIKADKKKISIIILVILGYIFTYSLPLIIIPANVIYGDLPPKPKLIAHRGASYLAPENTIKAGEAALLYDQVIGWEVDIRISFDGIPFLLHDNTLIRTTNISDHFPSRKEDEASTFNMSELRELDAGSWFVDKDPYGALAKGLISEQTAETYRGIRIPTFEEVLNFTRDNDLYLDFDPDRPPSDHPYYDSFYEILINMTKDSGVDLSKMMIPTQNTDFLEVINNSAPAVKLGWGGSPSITEFQSSQYNYSYINTGDGYSNHDYRNLETANMDVMVWTIESVERYCQLWCLGIDWVKTNSPYKFNELEAPLFYLPITTYLLTWIILYVVLISTGSFLYIKLRRKSMENNL